MSLARRDKRGLWLCCVHQRPLGTNTTYRESVSRRFFSLRICIWPSIYTIEKCIAEALMRWGHGCFMYQSHAPARLTFGHWFCQSSNAVPACLAVFYDSPKALRTVPGAAACPRSGVCVAKATTWACVCSAF
jgi:hypothetical protein